MIKITSIREALSIINKSLINDLINFDLWNFTDTQVKLKPEVIKNWISKQQIVFTKELLQIIENEAIETDLFTWILNQNPLKKPHSMMQQLSQLMSNLNQNHQQLNQHGFKKHTLFNQSATAIGKALLQPLATNYGIDLVKLQKNFVSLTKNYHFFEKILLEQQRLINETIVSIDFNINWINQTMWADQVGQFKTKINNLDDYLILYTKEWSDDYGHFCNWYESNVLDVINQQRLFSNDALLKDNYIFDPDFEAKLRKWIASNRTKISQKFPNFQHFDHFNLNQQVFLTLMINIYDHYLLISKQNDLSLTLSEIVHNLEYDYYDENQQNDLRDQYDVYEDDLVGELDNLATLARLEYHNLIKQNINLIKSQFIELINSNKFNQLNCFKK